MLKSTYAIPALPPPHDLENTVVLKALGAAHRHLGELKGRAASMPNQGILIDSLSLQEAKASSEIENIVTTQDELFKMGPFPEGPESPAAKEVSLYRDALKKGFDTLHGTKGLITNNSLIEMFRLLKGTQEGFRSTPGTALKNQQTGRIVYVPPQSAQTIQAEMTKLERFINEDDLCELDPLIKMALIHHQFESIHPFSDGNGRIGRILNVLYLTRSGLLEVPILYLSRYITSNKSDYYKLLQEVRERDSWTDWVLYMLRAVSETAIDSLRLIEAIGVLMAEYKRSMRANHAKIYSQDLLNNLFRHPYTRIEYVQNELGISRPTASKYLEQLVRGGLLQKKQNWRNVYYINRPLVQLFIQLSDPPESSEESNAPEAGESAEAK